MSFLKKEKIKENIKEKGNKVKNKSKRQVQRAIYGRTLLIIFLLLIQLFLFISAVLWLKDYSMLFYIFFEAIALLSVIAIMNRNENPMFKLAWIILVMAFPVLGAALYIFVQNQFGHKYVSWRVKVLSLEVKPFLHQNPEYKKQLEKENQQIAGLANYVASSCGHPVYQHTEVTYFPLGEDKFKRLLTELKKAKKFIFMEYFIIRDGEMLNPILEILKQKVKEGVEVRFMYDGFSSFTEVPVSFPKELESYGIKCRVFSPIRPVLSSIQNNRDHRKIVVIDGKVAFTGGVNLADEYINRLVRFGHWKDTAIMLKGEAVRSFTLMFLTMWNIQNYEKENYERYLLQNKNFTEIPNDGYIIPYGDCPFDNYYVAKRIYIDILNTAVKYVHIMTPYLILDNEMMEALCYAASRGVEVVILLPHIPDKKYAFWLAKSYYEELLLGGVQIYEYTNGFVHAKVMVSDNDKAVVGSSNLDFRSLYLHYECGAYMYQNSSIYDIEEDFQYCLSISQKILETDVKNEKLHVKILGKILRLVAPLM